MKAIIRIGYQEFMVPDEKLAMAAIKALSQAIVVHYRYECIEVQKDWEPKIEMKLVPRGARIVDNRLGKNQLRLEERTVIPAKEELGL